MIHRGQDPYLTTRHVRCKGKRRLRIKSAALAWMVWPLLLYIEGCSSGPNGMVTPTTAFDSASNRTSVFVGASIIQWWPLPVHNAGIFGQTTTQMLERFKADVLGHGYARVIILGGVNDVLQQGSDPPVQITTNLKSMASIARGAGLDVILISLPPLTYNGADLNASVSRANAGIQQLAADQGYVFVDIFTPMHGHKEYFIDGIHRNALGYSIMERSLAALGAC